MKFKNLGPITEGELQLGDLTIFCGGNNQGKTYVSYTLYGILKELKDVNYIFFTDGELSKLQKTSLIEFTKDEFNNRLAGNAIKVIEKNKERILKKVFNPKNSMFDKTKVKIKENEIIEFLNLDSQIQFERVLKYKDSNTSLEIDGDSVKFSHISVVDNEEIELEVYRTIIGLLINLYVDSLMVAFYIPAERTGINVFRSQLNANKVDLVNRITRDFEGTRKKVPLRSLKGTQAVFPSPINDYLDFIDNIQSYDSSEKLESNVSKVIREKIIKGNFSVDAETDTSYLNLTKYNEDGVSQAIPLHITSSSIKSIYGLDYFFNSIDKKQRNYLIIDEPEMNLHPENQVEFANILNDAISEGIKIIISTHSDFLMKKIQNIVLSNELKNVDKGLNRKNIKVYDFKDGKIEEIDFFDETKAYDNFNKTILKLETEYLDLIDEIAEHYEEVDRQ